MQNININTLRESFEKNKAYTKLLKYKVTVHKEDIAQALIDYIERTEDMADDSESFIRPLTLYAVLDSNLNISIYEHWTQLEYSLSHRMAYRIVRDYLKSLPKDEPEIRVSQMITNFNLKDMVVVISFELAAITHKTNTHG